MKIFFIIVLVVLIHLYFYNSEYVQKLDYKLYDTTSVVFNKFQKEESATYSVIVDIDEKSIQDFGQWPWSRIIDAELIKSINKKSPSAIGMNIIFPEEDRLSPISMQKFYQKYFNIKVDLNAFPPELQDNDTLLSEAILVSNVTLPVYLQNKFSSKEHCEAMSYENNVFSKVKTSLKTEEILCNYHTIQDKVENFGFINAWSDSDGIFRRVPLFMQHKEEVFPSFALATLRSFYKEVEIQKDEDTVLVNFLLSKPKVLSASDILNNKVSQSDIQGKIVIVGSSLIGLNSSYKINDNEYISNSMIHAMLIDNILNNTFLVQPKLYKKINVIVSLFFSLLILLFLFRKKYLLTSMTILALGVVSIVVLFLMYQNGIYISIGYLFVPFVSFFILSILFHLKRVSKEQQEQEKLFIRQSKLASMGEMISLIAHQWRQPLSAINGTVLNMDIDYRKENLDKQKFNEYLDDIEGRTSYLSKTINDFTDFFSKNKKAHSFKLSKLIQQAKDLSVNSASCSIEIIFEDNQEIELNGYASELVQSLLVLINNAIYACEKNLHNVDEGKIFIHVAQKEKHVLIGVEDNGGGVPKKNMKTIFNPYFTTKEQHNGTGLGLYILKLIVEDSMNGKILLKNTKIGALFTIKIPMNME